MPGAVTVQCVERVIVARHGESDYSARGLLNGDPSRRCRLTPTGREQARRLGELLRSHPIDLCVTSAFERTRETADIALAGRAVSRLVIPELNDHPAGDFEGKPIDEYLAWAHASASGEPIPGVGESRADVIHRFVRGYRVLRERPEPTALAVLHSLPISYLLSGPLQRLPLLEHAEPTTLSATDLLAAIERLEKWVTTPTW
jgi:2,3-bisphosphoglycerate-dependent phosphoglycerate mutase